MHKLKNQNSFRTLIVLAALAAGTVGMAQFRPGTNMAPKAVSISYVEIKVGMEIRVITDGGKYESKVIETEEQLNQLVGAYASLPEKGVEGRVTNVGSKACVAVYPGSFFVTAGPVFDPFLGRTTGGSLSIQGLLIAASFPINVKVPSLGGKHKESEVAATLGDMAVQKRATFIPEWTVGGWYFSRIGPNKGADLFQIDTRLMTNDSFGLQVAYINSSDVDAQSWTLHAIGRLSSRSLRKETTPWEVSGGIGPYFNLSPRADNRQVPVIDSHKSIGLSIFFDGSIRIQDRYSLHGTMWMINDRNTLTTRMALGVGYSF